MLFNLKLLGECSTNYSTAFSAELYFLDMFCLVLSVTIARILE